jgi:hypothetical protein
MAKHPSRTDGKKLIIVKERHIHNSDVALYSAGSASGPGSPPVSSAGSSSLSVSLPDSTFPCGPLRILGGGASGWTLTLSKGRYGALNLVFFFGTAPMFHTAHRDTSKDPSGIHTSFPLMSFRTIIMAVSLSQPDPSEL